MNAKKEKNSNEFPFDIYWEKIVRGDKIKVYTSANGHCYQLGIRFDDSGKAQWYLHEVLKPEIIEKRLGRYLVKLVGPRKYRPRGRGFAADCPESVDSILNDTRAKVAWPKFENRTYCIMNNLVPIFPEGGLMAVPVTISEEATAFERLPNQMDESRISDFIALSLMTPSNWVVCSNGGTSKSGTVGGASHPDDWHVKFDCTGHGMLPGDQAGPQVAGEYHILRGYAARGLVFDLNDSGTKKQLANAVVALQNAGYVVNLVGSKGRIFVFARTSIAILGWIACLELMGLVVVDTKEKFDGFTTSEQIDDLLDRATIKYDDYSQVLSGLRLDNVRISDFSE